MKAAKEAGEEHYDPKREDKIKGRNEARLALLEVHLKDPIGALDKALKCVWKLSSKGLGQSTSGKGFLQWLLLASSEVVGEAGLGGHPASPGSDG